MAGKQVVEEDKGFDVNIIPFAIMAGGWLAPFAMFWLYVWGPMRPFDYPAGDFMPPFPVFIAGVLFSLAFWWLPRSFFRVAGFERDGKLYEMLGVRYFRHLVPDGDLINRYRRRKSPAYRMIRDRRAAVDFIDRTVASEQGHLVFLVMGILTSIHAWQIGWHGWAVFLGIGNIIVNVYPILLQRYTRSRLQAVVARIRSHQAVS